MGVWLAAMAVGDRLLLLTGGHAHPHPCQEKGGGAKQRTGSHEEGGGQEGLMNPNKRSFKKKKKKRFPKNDLACKETATATKSKLPGRRELTLASSSQTCVCSGAPLESTHA